MTPEVIPLPPNGLAALVQEIFDEIYTASSNVEFERPTMSPTSTRDRCIIDAEPYRITIARNGLEGFVVEISNTSPCYPLISTSGRINNLTTADKIENILPFQS